MRNLRRKEIIFLMLSVAALFLLVLAIPRLQAKPKQTLILSSLTVTPVIKTQRNSPDVKIDANFRYNQSLQERYFSRNASITLSNAHIVDNNGKKYYMMTWAQGSEQSISPSSWGVGPTAGSATYQLWLRYFPKSVGKLTFNFEVVAHDGYNLPVSVTVRK